MSDIWVAALAGAALTAAIITGLAWVIVRYENRSRDAQLRRLIGVLRRRHGHRPDCPAVATPSSTCTCGWNEIARDAAAETLPEEASR